MMRICFFQDEINVCNKVSISLPFETEISDEEADKLWKQVVECIEEINPAYKLEKKALVFLANHISQYFGPEFSDNHKVIIG